MIYRGAHVAVIGGANSAGQGALFFARYAAKVSMVVRAAGLESSMSQYLIDRIASTPNIEVLSGYAVAAVSGEGHLQNVTLQHVETKEERPLDAAAMFIFIGSAPRSDIVAGLVPCDDKGFVLTGPDLTRGERGKPAGWTLDRDPYLFETAGPGIFAAGDVRAGANRRVAAAVGEGSAAIYSIHRYLETV
jgi:thioredoxin reductase (NADPH)